MRLWKSRFGAESTTIFSSVKGRWHLRGGPTPLHPGGRGSWCWNDQSTMNEEIFRKLTSLGTAFWPKFADWHPLPRRTGKIQKKKKQVSFRNDTLSKQNRCFIVLYRARRRGFVPGSSPDLDGAGFFDDSYERLLTPRWQLGHSVCGRVSGTTYFL